MAIQRINIKSAVEKQNQRSASNASKPKKESGMLGDLAATAITALPLIDTKYKVWAGVGVFVILYGVGSLIYDIFNFIF